MIVIVMIMIKDLGHNEVHWNDCKTIWANVIYLDVNVECMYIGAAHVYLFVTGIMWFANEGLVI